MVAGFRLRMAILDDVAALNALIHASVRELSRDVYSPQQIESALTYVFGVDTQLVRDGTYFVIEADNGEIAGCGGWSFRQTLFGGDQMKSDADPLLDPATEAARVRAFFVHPDFARRGVGSLLMRACFDAAYAAGFARLELMATLPGVPLYERRGFQASAPVWVTLPDDVPVPFVPMTCDLASVAVKICTIADRFQITGRGLVVVMQETYGQLQQTLKVGQTLELRRADGTRQPVTIKGFEISRVPAVSFRDKRIGLNLSGVTRDQVREGDELWTRPA